MQLRIENLSDYESYDTWARKKDAKGILQVPPEVIEHVGYLLATALLAFIEVGIEYLDDPRYIPAAFVGDNLMVKGNSVQDVSIKIIDFEDADFIFNLADKRVAISRLRDHADEAFVYAVRGKPLYEGFVNALKHRRKTF